MTGATNQPIDAALVPRHTGLATFMRLPYAPSPEGLDVALFGILWDGRSTAANYDGTLPGSESII